MHNLVALSIISLLSPLVTGTDPWWNETPGPLFQCEYVNLSFGGSRPPFILWVVQSDFEGEMPLEEIGTASGINATWLVDLQADISVGFAIQDSGGNTFYTGGINTIETSPYYDDRCLNNNMPLEFENGIPNGTPTTTPSYVPPAPANIAQPNATTSPTPSNNNTFTLGDIVGTTIGALTLIVTVVVGYVKREEWSVWLSRIVSGKWPCGGGD